MESLQTMIEKLDTALNPSEFCRLKEFVEPLILKSSQVDLICQLGAIYRKRELWQNAEEVLQTGRKLEPSQPEPYRSLALLYLRRDDLPWEENLQSAKTALETAIRLEELSNEHCSATHTLLGRTYISLGELKRAQAEFRRALEIDPGYTEAKYNLAVSLDTGEFPPNMQTIDLLKECIKEDPHYSLALRDLGWALHRSSPEQADAYLSRALLEAKDDVLLHIYFARVRFEKDPETAEKHYKQAIDIDPGDPELHRLLGLLYSYHGRLQEANESLFHAIELEPSNEESIAAYLKFLGDIQPENRKALYASAKQMSRLVPDVIIDELDAKVSQLHD